MVFYLILLVLVVICLYLLITSPAKQSAAALVGAGPPVLIVAGVLLTLFQRGAIGIPLIIFGFSWWQRNRARRPVDSVGGRKSTVRSASLEMELDHVTGEMDGWVLTGRMRGASLSSLDEEEVLSLYREIQSDADSAALLESFLDRYHPAWRDRVEPDSFGKQEGAAGFAGMTRQEAYQILGLEPGASQEEIHKAWRRLIKGVHPDSGGSEFLAAKINAARDLLLDFLRNPDRGG
jgi:hypothetical protein